MCAAIRTAVCLFEGRGKEKEMVCVRKSSRRHEVWEVKYFYKSLLLVTAGIVMLVAFRFLLR